MAKIEIFTTKTCPYCVKAKNLFKEKNITDYIEIDVSDNEELRTNMMKRANGRRSVPQIFINNQHIGGCDDLYALDKEGKLDSLIK